MEELDPEIVVMLEEFGLILLRHQLRAIPGQHVPMEDWNPASVDRLWTAMEKSPPRWWTRLWWAMTCR